MPKVEILRNTIDYIESLEELLSCNGQARPTPGSLQTSGNNSHGDCGSATTASQANDIGSRNDTVGSSSFVLYPNLSVSIAVTNYLILGSDKRSPRA